MIACLQSRMQHMTGQWVVQLWTVVFTRFVLVRLLQIQHSFDRWVCACGFGGRIHTFFSDVNCNCCTHNFPWTTSRIFFTPENWWRKELSFLLHNCDDQEWQQQSLHESIEGWIASARQMHWKAHARKTCIGTATRRPLWSFQQTSSSSSTLTLKLQTRTLSMECEMTNCSQWTHAILFSCCCACTDETQVCSWNMQKQCVRCRLAF